MKCLKVRANRICDNTERQKELTHLRKVFQTNGYPRRIVERSLNPRNRCIHKNETTTVNPKFLFLPYIKGLSEQIQRHCRNLHVIIIFKSSIPLGTI